MVSTLIDANTKPRNFREADRSGGGGGGSGGGGGGGGVGVVDPSGGGERGVLAAQACDSYKCLQINFL